MLKNTATTLLTAVQSRLELVGNELQVEKHRALQQLMLRLALGFCLGLAILLLVGLALVVWWDYRLTVLVICTSLVVALAAYLYGVLRRLLDRSEPVFAASLAELQEDLRQLRAASGHE